MTDNHPALEAEALRVRYRNGALGILDVSLQVARGDVVALLGPNGAGKTTTIRAITGFLRTEGAKVQGTVRLFGRDITGTEPQVASRLGAAVVPERRKNFPTMTVRENLLARRLPLRRAARIQALEEVFTSFPELADKGAVLAGTLSGGEQQMLALGRVLMTRPSLLIVDELTLGLHRSLHPRLFDVVHRVAAEGTAVLLVDESTHFALQASRYCYLLNGGAVRSHGPTSDYRGQELLVGGYTG